MEGGYAMVQVQQQCWKVTAEDIKSFKVAGVWNIGVTLRVDEGPFKGSEIDLVLPMDWLPKCRE